MTVDVGAHRILACHTVKCKSPGQLLQSNGLGCMGYAVPAAIGAQLCAPDKPGVALVGDGCMLMTAGELAGAAEHDLPIGVVGRNDAPLTPSKLKTSQTQMDPRAMAVGPPPHCDAAKATGRRRHR